MKTYLGLDIGGTKCACVLAGIGGGIHILDSERMPSHAERGLDDMLTRLFAATDRLLARAKDKPCAIGVSCGGPLDSANGIVLSPPNLFGWINVPIVKMLEERYGVPAFLQNDAKACALVEWKLGAGRGTKNMIFCTMGTGMGAGIISGGRLLTGACDMAGEIGHLRLAEDGPIGFGKAGSFEGFVSGGGISRQARKFTQYLIDNGEQPAWIADGNALDDCDAKLLARYAFDGDSRAIEFYNEIGRMLGRGLSLLADAFNPEIIVIGSIFTRSEALLRPSMEAEMKRETIPYSYSVLKVAGAETGESLGDYAAVMTALHALGVDPTRETCETNPKPLEHFERLFKRHPQLETVRESVMDAYMALLNCYENGGKTLICGNGGSCSDAEHIVGELMKGFLLKRPVASPRLQGALPAIALSAHTALSTAFSNDISAEYAFAQQVFGYSTKGDVFIGISTGGNSKNVLRAAETAKEKGLVTIALTGGDGGALKDVCDISIIAPARATAEVQEMHLPIYHALCAMLEAKLFAE